MVDSKDLKVVDVGIGVQTGRKQEASYELSTAEKQKTLVGTVAVDGLGLGCCHNP